MRTSGFFDDVLNDTMPAQRKISVPSWSWNASKLLNSADTRKAKIALWYDVTPRLV